MRLTAEEATAIRESARKRFGPRATVWLFGSRADDTQRGGDIDLYIELREPIPDLVLQSCQMYADLQIALGARKIDIVASDPTVKPLPIYDVAKKTGIQL